MYLSIQLRSYKSVSRLTYLLTDLLTSLASVSHRLEPTTCESQVRCSTSSATVSLLHLHNIFAVIIGPSTCSSYECCVCVVGK